MHIHRQRRRTRVAMPVKLHQAMVVEVEHRRTLVRASVAEEAVAVTAPLVRTISWLVPAAAVVVGRMAVPAALWWAGLEAVTVADSRGVVVAVGTEVVARVLVVAVVAIVVAVDVTVAVVVTRARWTQWTQPAPAASGPTACWSWETRQPTPLQQVCLACKCVRGPVTVG